MSELHTPTALATQFSQPPSTEAHVVQFYTDDAFLIDCLGQFVCSGLGAGEPVIVVATKKHREGLARSLQERGVDVSGAVKQRRYIVLDAAETMAKFMGRRLPDERKFESIIGSVIREAEKRAPGRRVAVFGEMVALLWEEKKFEAALQLEQLWNALAKTHFFYLRCAYPTSGFQGQQEGEPYTNICAEHSKVIPAEN